MYYLSSKQNLHHIYCQAAACFTLARSISHTAQLENKADQNSTKSSDIAKPADHSVKRDNRNVKNNATNEWIPTEKIVKMWIDKKEKKNDKKSYRDDENGRNENNENSADPGSALSGQRMRASVTAETLQVFFRFSEEEYY